MDKLHNLRWDALKEDVLVWCVTHQPFHAWQQPVPSRLTTTPAGTTPASHPHVLGPRLWWRALCQGLAMCCTSGPVISSEFTPLYDHKLTPLYEQQAHTTLRTASSHHSTTSELTSLYDQRAHTILRLANSHHSTNNEHTPLYKQRAHTTYDQLEPPPSFDFRKPDEWPRWFRRFDQFRVASGLAADSEEKQVSTLLYCLGEEAEEVLAVSDTKPKKTYKAVVDTFNSFFGVRRNIIYERARSNTRVKSPARG
ncbi:hypothetical protein EMCRGX_G002935 [Ephydatia muelleri]